MTPSVGDWLLPWSCHTCNHRMLTGQQLICLPPPHLIEQIHAMDPVACMAGCRVQCTAKAFAVHLQSQAGQVCVCSWLASRQATRGCFWQHTKPGGVLDGNVAHLGGQGMEVGPYQRLEPPNHLKLRSPIIPWDWPRYLCKHAAVETCVPKPHGKILGHQRWQKLCNRPQSGKNGHMEHSITLTTSCCSQHMVGNIRLTPCP
jgi:hypothetical protein